MLDNTNQFTPYLAILHYARGVAIAKTERLMNLVIALLSTRQFLTAERIRESVAGYEDTPTSEAFHRMFERDKGELRDLGVPLETGPASAFSPIEGYRINRGDYELPDIELTSAEAAAVAIAVRFWESPELTTAANSALLKLRAAGVQVEPDTFTAAVALPRSRGSEPALGKLLSAIAAGQAVRFSHRSAANTPFVLRDVEPWAVVTSRGRWYLVGHDRDRGQARTFRLSRIGDDVVEYGEPGAVHRPAGVDPRALVDQVTRTHDGEVARITVWVAQGRAHDIRRAGREVGPHELAGRAGSVIALSVRSRDWIVRLIAGHGPDAIVLEPADLNAEIAERTRALATALDPAAAGARS